MFISTKVISETVDMLRRHLTDYQSDIEEAYGNADNALVVSLKAKYTAKGGGIAIDTAISCVKEKIEDKSNRFIQDLKDPLFEDKTP